VGKGGRDAVLDRDVGPPLPTLRFRPEVIHLLLQVS
jgi:hypothetical protein